MSKLKIIVTMKNEDEQKQLETMAIINDKTLIYNENKTTKVKYNYQTHNLIRENKELLINYKFKQNTNSDGYIIVKDLKKKLVVNIKTTRLEIENNNINIEYELENNKFFYTVEVIK